MKNYIFLFALFLVTLCALPVLAQDDDYKPNIYGFTTSEISAYTPHKEPVLANGLATFSFATAQTNIFIAGNIGSPQFRYLLDLQILANFGDQISLQPFLHQAWGEWRPSDAFGIRLGSILTPFGLFNAIHSRPALYWFVERPLAYAEPSFVGEMGVLRPEFSNFSVSGTTRLTDDIKLDYFAYLGNTGIQVGQNVDLNTKKLFGGRVAIRTDNIEIGVSPVLNRIEMEDSASQNNNTIFAFDAKVEYAGFTLLGEYTTLSEMFERLPGIPASTPIRTGSFNKTLWWASLGYNITDNWLVYGAFDYYRNTDTDSRFLNTPLTRVRGGINFKPVDKILLKLEANHYQVAGRFEGVDYNAFQSFKFAAVFSF